MKFLSHSSKIDIDRTDISMSSGTLHLEKYCLIINSIRKLSYDLVFDFWRQKQTLTKGVRKRKTIFGIHTSIRKELSHLQVPMSSKQPHRPCAQSPMMKMKARYGIWEIKKLYNQKMRPQEYSGFFGNDGRKITIDNLSFG